MCQNGNGNGNGRLTGKQRAFVNEWFKDFNGVKAAGRAGYQGNYWTLAAIASENLKKPKIKAELERRWAIHGITAEEVIARLSAMARSNIADFVGAHGAIDWDAVKARGELVKKVVHRKGQESQIELYDAKGALELVGKTMGLFVDRQKVEHEGTVTIMVDWDDPNGSD